MQEPEPEQGINLSHHATVDDWSSLQAKAVCFASVTVTENVNWSDLAAERALAAAHDAGIHAGARHYARPGAVREQAHYFVRIAEKLGAFEPGALAPTLEVRAEGVDDGFVKTWIKAVRHDSGVERVLVYADLDLWTKHLHPDKWADKEVILWLTKNNNIPGRPGWFHPRLGIHQYRSGTEAIGAHGAVGQDAIVYPFTLTDLLL
jgi:hypothetical protein